MGSTLVITIVVAAAVGWLAVIGAAALRSRGPEEVSPNLSPGATDDYLETARIERAQQAAIFFSAFLAIGLPLYYLTEIPRQESFVEQFHEESVHRGEELIIEFKCYDCHGPDGVGGVASFTEKRSGVVVDWEAPALNDIFYRYDREAVRYWITFGRGNSPMPAWGVAGGGPLNEQQVDDMINYLEEHQIPQDEVAAEVESVVVGELRDLVNADAAMGRAITSQRQVIADMERSVDLAPVLEELSERAEAISESLSDGLDTDGDGVSDTAETALTELTDEARAVFIPDGLEPLTFDPNDPATYGRPDLEVLNEALQRMDELIETVAPTIAPNAAAIRAVLEAGGEDTDGDGIPDEAEGQIAGQFGDAISKMIPSDLIVVSLDPENPQSASGVSDSRTAARAISALETVALNQSVQAENLDRTLQPARDSLSHLLQAQEERAWEFDFQTIADSVFGGDVERAQRVVGLYNGYCARCHTSGYSAGIPFAQEAGSGAFGPALWDGRPAVQFLSDEELMEFLIVGAVENEPYGVNGFGSGQMPGFGMILSEQDLMDLAVWLRSGDLTGQGGS